MDFFKKDRVFLEKIRKYIENPEFERLKTIKHHSEDIYTHTLRVTYLAYKLGKLFKADEESLLKGALFHDLYFHNWRDKEYILNHGWVHPNIALENAKKIYGELSPKVENIISSHMWPFNIKNFPRYKESILVSIADKIIAFFEIILMFKNPIKNFFHK